MFHPFTQFQPFVFRVFGWQTTREIELLTRDGQVLLTADRGVPLSVAP